MSDDITTGWTWEESTRDLSPEQKALRAFEWAAGMAHQGDNVDSAWDKAMQETLSTMREMVARYE